MYNKFYDFNLLLQNENFQEKYSRIKINYLWKRTGKLHNSNFAVANTNGWFQMFDDTQKGSY